MKSGHIPREKINSDQFTVGILAPYHCWPTLDGLVPRGGNPHVSERSADGTKIPEFVDRYSFVPKAEINYFALREIISQIFKKTV